MQVLFLLSGLFVIASFAILMVRTDVPRLKDWPCHLVGAVRIMVMVVTYIAVKDWKSAEVEYYPVVFGAAGYIVAEAISDIKYFLKHRRSCGLASGT